MNRARSGAGLLFLYFLLPIFLVNGPWRADTNNIRTMELKWERTGKYVELDRQDLTFVEGVPHIIIKPLEPPIGLKGEIPAHSGNISVKGKFISPYRLQIESFRLHPPGRRDIASYIGLLFIGICWFWPLRRKGQVLIRYLNRR